MNKPSDTSAKPKLMLAVGDDELRRLLVDALSFNASDIEVTVRQPAEVFQMAKAEEVDSVLLDLSGGPERTLETLAMFKDELPSVTPIIVTTEKNEQFHELCIDMGVALYFELPVPLGTVAMKIYTLLHAEQSGFSGSLDQLTLPDIIQVISEKDQNVLLRIISDHGSATIALEGGEVVHAQTRDKRGEDAFYDICLWKGGSFELVHLLRHESRSVLVARPKLLLEASKLLEEGDGKRSITGWYSVSGLRPRQREQVAEVIPSIQDRRMLEREARKSISEITQELSRQSGQDRGAMPSDAPEIDSPGPVIPSQIIGVRDVEPTRSSVILKNMVGALILIIIFLLAWWWNLPEKVAGAWKIMTHP